MFDNVECVRLECSYNTDTEELKNFMGDVWGQLAEMVKTEETPSACSTEVVGKGERIIDPATMQIYSETVDRTIKTTITIPGQDAMEMIVDENREYGYEKNAPKPAQLHHPREIGNARGTTLGYERTLAPSVNF